MTLIKSISGIRGTLGGNAGENLTPIDVVKYTAAFGSMLLKANQGNKVVVGRDARISGPIVHELVVNTLMALGIDVVDAGLSTTPTVEMAVVEEAAAGGIILTASHNPKQWNALKLLNHKGEFISAADGAMVLELAESNEIAFASVDHLGSRTVKDFLPMHIQKILDLPLVKRDLIAAQKFKVAIDAVNSVGGIAVPALLKALGVEEIVEINCEPSGHFAHNPEPLPEHLGQIASEVKSAKCDLGIVVDPDVDRLALISDDAEMFGEEYTLVAVADYYLKHTPGPTVSNLSSTRALRDITEKAGQQYEASAVGEVNVVEKMKEIGAVIGGEGNGGIIVPELHYGRDALAGIALFLSHLAETGLSASALRATYPNYRMSKNKAELQAGTDVDGILEKIQKKYKKQPINTIDGVKIEFDQDWVHLRKSNTEPIIRIYAESDSINTAENLTRKILQDIGDLLN
jgi:phosphomannomutase